MCNCAGYFLEEKKKKSTGNNIKSNKLRFRAERFFLPIYLR